MKTLASLIPIALLALFAAAFPGCSTTPEDPNANTLSPERVYKITRLAAYGSAIAMSLQNPGSTVAIGHARDGFCQMKEAQNWDLTTAITIATANGLQILDSSEGRIILSGVPLLIDTFVNQNYDLRSQPYAQAVVTGTCEGLTLALGPSTRDFALGETLLREAVATRP